MSSCTPTAALLDLIDAAALDEGAWKEVLAQCCAACGGHKAMVYWVQVDASAREWRGPMWGHLHGWDAAEAATSHELGAGPYLPLMHRVPRDGAYTGDMLLPNEEYWRTPYYETHGKRLGLGQLLGQVLGADSPYDFAQLNIVRRKDDPLLGPEHLDFMRAVAPHVSRSARIASRRFDREKEIERWRTIDENRGGGHLVMADHGELLHANAVAFDVLGPYPLKARLVDGRPLGAALLGVTAPVSLVIARNGREPLDAEARPLARTFGAERRPAISLTFHHPDRPRVTAEHLCTRWGLTPAQGALAMSLLGGVTPEEYSRERGISLATTRTHLKALRAKLGAGTTAQAVAILARAMS